MVRKKLSDDTTTFWVWMTLPTVVAGWLFLLFAVLGIFSIVLISLVCAGVLITWIWVYYEYKREKKISYEFLIVLGSIALVATLLTAWSTPTVFTGRDQGALAQAALQLAQTGDIAYQTKAADTFFSIYGPGKALNFPGFFYNENGALVPQFPLVYIAWLGAFVALFGVDGLLLANVVLFVFFGGSIYLLAREHVSRFFGIVFLVLLLSSFLFTWFLKFTLSEMMALALVWIFIWSLYSFFRSQRTDLYWLLLLSGSLLVFARIEGIVLVAMGIITLCFSTNALNFILVKPLERCIVPLLAVTVFFGINFEHSIAFYKSIAKALLGTGSSTIPGTESSDSPLTHLAIYSLYGLLPVFLFGLTSIFYFFWKKRWLLLLPFFITAPTFYYFLDPHISDDHPWMLRRFLFTLSPVLLFFSLLLVSELWTTAKSRSLGQLYYAGSIVILVTILFTGLVPTLQYATVVPNASLLEQTEQFSKRFEPNDLILVDKNVTGDNFSMIAGPLRTQFNKNAVYFFNPNDYGTLVESGALAEYERVFLVVNYRDIQFYNDSVMQQFFGPAEQFHFSTIGLNKEDTLRLPPVLPAVEERIVDGAVIELRK